MSQRVVLAPNRKLTWPEVTRREPALQTLAAEIRATRPPATESFCANDTWYGDGLTDGLRDRMSDLVGYSARSLDRALHSTEAYDVAYDYLYRLLPDCRGDCGCLWAGDVAEMMHDESAAEILGRPVPAEVRRAWDRMRRHVAPLVFQQAGAKCAHCGSRAELTVDHIIPISRGGLNHLDNFETLCLSCNARKGSRV